MGILLIKQAKIHSCYRAEKCIIIKNLRFIARKRKIIRRSMRKGRILLRHGNRHSEINRCLKFSKKMELSICM